MGRRWADALYVVALIAIVVSVDVLFLSGRFWLRLLTNIAIVVAFVAFYPTFRRISRSRGNRP